MSAPVLALADDPAAVALRELAPLLDARYLAWQDSALCAYVGGDVWFPDKGEPTGAAKRVCADCTVQAECLEYALDHDERFGIWGGKSERERRRIRARQIAEGTRAPSVRRCTSGKHLMTPDNIYVYSGNNTKTCRACKAERDAERRQREQMRRAA